MEGPEDPQGTPGRQDDSSLEGLTHAWGRVAVNNSWVNGLAETLKCTSPSAWLRAITHLGGSIVPTLKTLVMGLNLTPTCVLWLMS